MAPERDDAAALHSASYPFLLVDKVMGMESGTRAVGLRNVTANDPLLAGGGRRPLTMGRTLLIEAFTQLAAMALGADAKHPAAVEVTAIDSMSFLRSPVPGDQIILDVELAADGSATNVLCKAAIDGQTVAEGSLVLQVAAGG